MSQTSQATKHRGKYDGFYKNQLLREIAQHRPFMIQQIGKKYVELQQREHSFVALTWTGLLATRTYELSVVEYVLSCRNIDLL